MEPAGSISRRQFFGAACAACLAAIAAGCEDTTRGLNSNVGATNGLNSGAMGGAGPSGYVAVAPQSSVSSTPTAFSVQGVQGQVYVFEQGGQILALSDICTHAGCEVTFDPGSSDFYCPCHGSVFDQSGNNVSGPAPTPLGSFQTMVSSGVVYIQA